MGNGLQVESVRCPDCSDLSASLPTSVTWETYVRGLPQLAGILRDRDIQLLKELPDVEREVVLKAVESVKELERRSDLACIWRACLDLDDPQIVSAVIDCFPWGGSEHERNLVSAVVAGCPSAAVYFREEYRTIPYTPKDVASAEYLVANHTGLLLDLIEHDLVSEFFDTPQIFFTLREATWAYSIEAYQRLSKGNAFKQSGRIEELRAQLGRSFWGAAHQLGGDIFSLTANEVAFIQVANEEYSGGIGTVLAFVPRYRWLEPRVKTLCEKYREVAGYEYRERGEEAITGPDGELEIVELGLRDHLLIKNPHRYLDRSEEGRDPWSFLKSVFGSFFERRAAHRTHRPLHLAIFPGYDPASPEVYESYVGSFQKLESEGVDVVVVEIESKADIAHLTEQFETFGIDAFDTCSIHLHGNSTEAYLNYADYDSLTVDDTEFLRELFSWVRPGGHTVIEVCNGADGYPSSKCLLGVAAELRPDLHWTGFTAQGAIYDMGYDGKLMTIEHTEPDSMVNLSASERMAA